jgi:hypothetical protein
MEEVVDGRRSSGVCSVKRSDLLDSLVSIDIYGAIIAVNSIFDAAPMIFKLAQASPAFAANFKPAVVSTTVPNAIEGSRQLVEALDGLHEKPDALKVFVEQVAKQCMTQQLNVREKLMERGELGKSEAEMVAAATIDAEKLKAATKRLTRTLKRALKAAYSCEARDKLNECLDGLDKLNLFNLVHPPARLPEDDAGFDKLYTMFDVPAADRNYGNGVQLTSQWKAHIGSYVAPTGPVTQRSVWNFWWSLQTSAPFSSSWRSTTCCGQ